MILMIMVELFFFFWCFTKNCVLCIPSPIFKTSRTEDIIYTFCQKRRLPRLWNFPKATHLVRDGPGIHPQTGPTLKPTAILSS